MARLCQRKRKVMGEETKKSFLDAKSHLGKKREREEKCELKKGKSWHLEASNTLFSPSHHHHVDMWGVGVCLGLRAHRSIYTTLETLESRWS